ncbi:unnamed protein product [Sphenostylis stenocarpa]|uniref:Uncharacterized protein n=1 Tax=Sphenostylis stenocarpa TaxID=92480 RepID=A0AA86SUI5_9FABA|nr:unnamed protein product [Sphenostylis stenocarpa]
MEEQQELEGVGHLIPMIEFAQRLSRHHNLQISFLVPTCAPPSEAQTTLLSFLPPVTLSDLPPNGKMESISCVAVHRSLPSLRHTLLSLLHPLLRNRRLRPRQTTQRSPLRLLPYQRHAFVFLQ